MITIYIQEWFPNHINLQDIWKETFSSMAHKTEKWKFNFAVLQVPLQGVAYSVAG